MYLFDINKIDKDRNCKECGLYKGCKSPKMNYTGLGLKKCLMIGEANGRQEDEKGTQFIGDSGQLLRKKLNEHNLDLDRDFWKINCCSCMPPNNRKPKRQELKYCWFKVEEVINKLKPKFIWLLGGSAIESFFINMYPTRFSKLSVGLWRGYCIPDKKTNAWILPLFHPSSLLHNQDAGLENIFDIDLRNAVNALDKESPKFENYNEKIDILIDFDSIIDRLKQLKDKKIIAFDYETTGIKPYKKGNKIYTVSVSDGDRTFAFPYEYQNRFNDEQKNEIKKLWVNILSDKNIKKVGQNICYEEDWSRTIFGTPVVGWFWDTMLFNHIFDARGGNTGLKFQSYIHYGIEDYAKSISKYMTKGSDGFNKLDKAPLDNLLYYNALDSLLTYKIYLDNQKELDSLDKNQRQKIISIYDLFHRGILTFVDIQQTGIHIDTEYYKKQEESLNNEIEDIMNYLNNSLEAKRFDRYTGDKIKWDSPKDLRILLFEILKLPCYKKTLAGNESVDVEVLNSFEDVPIINKLLEYRKLFKANNTYLNQFTKYEIDGKIHPSFGLHIARTGRSCIAKGTKIIIVDKNSGCSINKNIEDIGAGDLVYCYDDNLMLRIKKVVWSGKTGYKKVIRLHCISNKINDNYLDLTPEHKVRLISGNYVEAKNIKYKEHLLGESDYMFFNKIEHINKWIDVYDIEVEDCHNFIANGICVHNSSSHPNMQNQPVRDDKIKKIIRGGIIPSKGNKLLEVDYGALECRGIAIASKDPELIKDIDDPHSYWAKEVFIITEEEKTKDLRFYTKNQFVFPLFYGSWYKSCAANLWKMCIDLKTGKGIMIKEHLINKGIRNFEDFENHIQRIEERFWNKFKIVKEWQNKLIENYNKTGYVSSFFGFKRTGYLSRNEIINSPIQGGSFHILLTCLIKLNEIRKKENWKTKIICQIHDSIIFDICPDEFDHVIKTANYIMTDWIREQNPWIIVPLIVEFEATEIDESWYYKKEIKI